MSLLSGIFDGVKKDIRKISKETSETRILVLGAMVEALAEIRQEFTTKVDLFDLPYDRYGAEKKLVILGSVDVSEHKLDGKKVPNLQDLFNLL